MKIIELKSSNIKRLKAVELILDEKKNLILVTGKNAQGKTSILDSIWFALGGKKAVQDKPIREGEEKAEIEINVDGYIVKRSFTDKGSYLVITNKEGSKYSNPQEFLDFIVGNLSFDPLIFSRLDSQKRVAELTKVVGIDFTEFDENKKELANERLLIGRELKAIGQINEATLEQAKITAVQKEISITELTEKVSNLQSKQVQFANCQKDIASNNIEIAKLKKEIQTLEDRNKQLSEIQKPEGNLDELKNQLANAEKTNSEIREAKRILEDHKKYTDRNTDYESLSVQIDDIDELKNKQLSEAKMPIEGLSWDEDQVFYKGIPFDQLSSSEQLRISMAIAMASNPKLKVILIRDGSLLDQDNLKVIEEMAKDKDFQVWIEKVDESGKIGIYIEEGEVKEINN